MRARRTSLPALALVGLLVAACSDGPAPPPAPPCDQACKDGAAVRALRETLKLVYNLTLQGKPVGDQDATIPCIRGGSARVFGRATSDAIQGATQVELTYVLDRCAYAQKDEEPPENYDLAFTGTIEQRGTLAVQPTATTAILLVGKGVGLSGVVYDPAIPYEEASCDVDLTQSGNRIAGSICGRSAGSDL